MKSFEDYILQHKHKNFRPGDKVKYIGNGNFLAIEPNEVCTFLEFRKLSGISYVKVKVKNYHLYFHPKDIIKI